MSVGLYYTAHRDTPLSDDERAVLTRIVDEGERALLEEARRRLAGGGGGPRGPRRPRGDLRTPGPVLDR
ncbi:hypothetical protein B005_0772 [Nocardiopsis alba ATCC BAA-2165]|uniref:Uncharacterized protein n=1 Tax=Nocardiopsis alba (strain ATCC BAA-2165 / BE74) TaxID=1205910 RepID=J7LHE8_NOCAA|nr:hypothetical protein B005_0772 [Nocardiopsis alba ATCC BAA-2165]